MTIKKWIWYVTFVTILSLVFFLFFFERNSVYTRLLMSLDSCNVPCTAIEIQGSSYDVKFSLGSKLPLSLNKMILAQLEKTDAGKIKIKDLAGNELELQAFYLKKITLGNLVFKDVLTIEMNEEQGPGFIGRPLLVKHNLLLDLRNATILISDRFKNMKRAGYGREDWVQVPLEVGQAGVVLQVGTDKGVAKFSLGLAMADSMLKSSFIDETEWIDIRQEAPYFTSTTFTISGNEFGEKKLYSLPISNDMSGMDGILAMDFLYKHVVYIDFNKQCAYISK